MALMGQVQRPARCVRKGRSTILDKAGAGNYTFYVICGRRPNVVFQHRNKARGN